MQNVGQLCRGEYEAQRGGDCISVTSKSGETFEVTGTAEAMLATALPANERKGLRRRIWESWHAGVPFRVTSENLHSFRSLPPFQQRADDLLEWVSERSLPLGAAVHVYNTSPAVREINGHLLAMLGVDEPSEISFYLKYLCGRGLVDVHDRQDKVVVELLPDGLIHLDAVRGQVSASQQGFVAMWFNESMATAYANAVEPAIREAGYRAYRIDRHEHVNRIDDEIYLRLDNHVSSWRISVASQGSRGAVFTSRLDLHWGSALTLSGRRTTIFAKRSILISASII